MASKRRLRRKMCSRKAPLPALWVAEKVALDMRAHGAHVHAYRCAFGAHWHVGRPSGQRAAGG